MKRYVVAVSGLNDEDEKEFLAFIRENSLSWWHWIGNFWLLIDRDEKTSSDAIRDRLREFKSSKRCIVIENLADETWNGFGPRDKDMFGWVQRNWDINS